MILRTALGTNTNGDLQTLDQSYQIRTSREEPGKTSKECPPLLCTGKFGKQWYKQKVTYNHLWDELKALGLEMWVLNEILSY